MDLGQVCDKTSVNGSKYLYGAFNARLGPRRPGEEELFGELSFGREAVHRVDVPNRHLLLEFCTDRCYYIANTFEERPLEQKVPFMEPGTHPMSTPSVSTFATLDLLLAPALDLESVATVSSVREATIATDHCMVFTKLACKYTAPTTKERRSRKDFSAFFRPAIRQEFVRSFADHNKYAHLGSGDIVEEARHYQKLLSCQGAPGFQKRR